MHIFTLLLVVGNSLRILVDEGLDRLPDYTLDYVSVGSLARTLIEGAILFHYVAEQGVSKDDRDLRLAVLDLHDCTRRARFFKGLGDKSEYRKFKHQMPELRAKIERNPLFNALTDEKQKELLGGNTIYVDGLRGAARAAGWDDIDRFDAIHTYLSVQSHLAPMSFYRFGEHIDFVWPTGFQFAFVANCMEHALIAILRCAARILAMFPDIFEKLDGDVRAIFETR